jgi:hypothetical protein
LLPRVLCLAFLIVLSRTAWADDVGADEPLPPPPGVAAMGDDLWIDPDASLDLSLTPGAAWVPDDLPAARLATPQRSQDRVEKRFSLGVDVKTRPRVGDEARQTGDASTLADQVEGVVKRSTFGVTGTSRF